MLARYRCRLEQCWGGYQCPSLPLLSHGPRMIGCISLSPGLRVRGSLYSLYVAGYHSRCLTEVALITRLLTWFGLVPRGHLCRCPLLLALPPPVPLLGLGVRLDLLDLELELRRLVLRPPRRLLLTLNFSNLFHSIVFLSFFLVPTLELEKMLRYLFLCIKPNIVFPL
jgi:hypothetical protein